MSAVGNLHEASWYEALARERIAGLVDADSFSEVMGPERRAVSPHLDSFGLTQSFDDGMIVGRAELDRRPVLIAAQEGRFLGGSIGEVHGAKLVGMLRAARIHVANGCPHGVLLLLDTGGVRLQEANAGEIAVSEVIRAIVDARLAGVPVLALIGGRSGAFGGGGIVAACCSGIIVSKYGRIGVSGPEVIETNKGVEEFDSRDRALVWRITGGRTRLLIGGADRCVSDRIGDFRQAALELVARNRPLTLQAMKAEHRRLADRVLLQSDCRDSPEIWRRLGIPQPESVPDLSDESFLTLQRSVRVPENAR
jgi:malonate decarboxylase beta subunit